MEHRGATSTPKVAYEQGQLLARPANVDERGAGGLRTLELDSPRDGVLYVPPTYRSDVPAPLVLMLHGAGGTGRNGLGPLLPLADAAGLILLSPDSRLQTWDVIYGRYGPDVAYIDRALSKTFNEYAIDPRRLAVGGFSDGASYALSIGIANGYLFTHVLAFSPGFMAPAARHGRPHIFVSHGVHDRTLPIDSCSRVIVPNLRNTGYDVLYREFDGPHTVPPDIAMEAVEWFAANGP